MRRACFLALILGCSAGDDSAPADPPCPAGFVREGGSCAPRFDDCAEGQLPSFGGGCPPIGPTCAAGFRGDGHGGCDPILPEAACPDGQLAVPGDASCHALSPCGPEPWGDIPDSPSTRWVDAKAADGGDGSRPKPFKTVADAIAAAPADGVVAIAAGTYTLNVDVKRPVRIHGRCAEMVELRGDPALTTDHVIQATADLEVKGVSITSPYIGIGVYGLNGDVRATIDSVRLHDTEFCAIEALGYARPPSVTVRNTLIERPRAVGMTFFGASAVVEKSVVRGGRVRSDGKLGEGIVLRPRKEGAQTHPARLELKGSLLEANRRTGLQIFGAAVLVEGSIIRRTRADDTGTGGPGILAVAYESTPADLTVRGSLFEENQIAQISVQSGKALIEHTIARRGVLLDGKLGGGLFFDVDVSFRLTDSLIEKTRSFGVAVTGAAGSVENTLVRDISEERVGRGGIGIQLGDDEETHVVGKVKVLRTRIDRCAQVGLLVVGANVEAEELAVFDTKPLHEGIFGDGIGVNTNRVIGGESIVSTLSLRRSFVSRANRAALTIFGADVSVESSRLSCSPISINAERSYAPEDMGVKFERDFALEDLGGNACGCGAPGPCRVESTGIAPLE